jgi:hypothetical protein
MIMGSLYVPDERPVKKTPAKGDGIVEALKRQADYLVQMPLFGDDDRAVMKALRKTADNRKDEYVGPHRRALLYEFKNGGMPAYPSGTPMDRTKASMVKALGSQLQGIGA